MSKDTNYIIPIKQIPPSYQLCFNDSCPKAGECLRHLAGLSINNDQVWGPAVYPNALRNGECCMFKQTRIMHGAYGFNTIFDEVKQKDNTPIRNAIKEYLGGHGTYYLYHHGKKLLTPEQQEWIIQLFKHHGYRENLIFDGYRDEYDFSL